MTKENPAPRAKPMISMNAIMVPAVSACFGSTMLKWKNKIKLVINKQTSGTRQEYSGVLWLPLYILAKDSRIKKDE